MIWDKLSRLMILGHLMVIKWQEQTFFRASLMGYNSRVGMGHILESKGPHICWSKFSINHQLCVPQFGSIPIILIILGYWYMLYNTNINIYIHIMGVKPAFYGDIWCDTIVWYTAPFYGHLVGHIMIDLWIWGRPHGHTHY